MRPQIAIVYNEPCPSNYDALGEGKAVLGVLEAAASVHQALHELDYGAVLVPLLPPLEIVERKLKGLEADLVFNLFEGFGDCPETEALVPEILSKVGIPCTGCPAPILRLALDKAKVKVLLKVSGIPTPEFQLLNPETVQTLCLAYPCIVKPCGEDASHGLSPESVVDDFAALEKRVSLISQFYGGVALVEEFIDGREFNATVLGNSGYTVLPASEIVYSLPAAMPRILTFAAKWEPDSTYFRDTRVICPVNTRAEEEQLIAETAVLAFKAIGGYGYARVDMRLDREGRLNVIEVNPNPDISPGAGAVLQAGAAGMTYSQFIDKLVQMALQGEPEYSIREVNNVLEKAENREADAASG